MVTREIPRLPTPAATLEYAIDSWQRSILFLDVMRQRAAQYEAHAAEPAPNVLDYKAGLVIDGRRLARPVNYLLTRIVPPAAINIFPDLDTKRDIVQNAIDLWTGIGLGTPRVGNMLAKKLSFLAHADAAGILGARVPIVLTSRADSVRTRLASCAVAAVYANARRAKAAVAA